MTAAGTFEAMTDAERAGWTRANVPDTVKTVKGERPRGSTPRTHRLATRAASQPYGCWLEWRELSARFRPRGTADPHTEEADQWCRVLDRLRPCIRPEELIVGARRRAEPTEEGHQDCTRGWEPGGYGHIRHFAAAVPESLASLKAEADRGLIAPVGACCHRVADYEALLQIGCRALARRARELAAKRTGAARSFSLAVARYHEALMAHAEAYAETARFLATATEDETRRAELLTIAAVCTRVPAAPAQTFREAVQAFWFLYFMTTMDVGRIDQVLFPYYQRDREQGSLQDETALELLECLLIKMHRDYAESSMNVSSIHTLTLGGLTPEGGDGTNALSFLFLRAARNLRLMRPSLYIRCHADTPHALVHAGVEMLAEGLSEPSFYGDAPIVAGLERIGVPTAEARNYALGGCTEVVSPGRGNWGAPTGWLNIALLTDEALRETAALGMTTLANFWPVFDRHLDRAVAACREATAWMDEAAGTDLRFSAAMPCCLEAGADFFRGGADTRCAQWAGVGLPNAAEMVYAADRLAFSRRQPLAPLFALLDSDDEDIRRRLRSLPRFGQGEDGVDKFAASLLTRISTALEAASTPQRSCLTLGHLSGGQSINIDCGDRIGPTLDGRRARQPLADSLAGTHGAATHGPTALIRSICALDHSRLQGGNVSTLMLNRDDFSGPGGQDRLTRLVETFIGLGGSQLQINLVGAETLRQAQAAPEAHRGLLVRVAGYSADFTRISTDIQDEMIARLEGFTP